MERYKTIYTLEIIKKQLGSLNLLACHVDLTDIPASYNS